MGDLTDRRWIYLKGFLFAGIILGASVLLWLENPEWRTAALIMLLIWSSARAYYFIFYVIEKYVDSRYRFSGVCSFVRYLLTREADDEKK
jgi:hypothetical protein